MTSEILAEIQVQKKVIKGIYEANLVPIDKDGCLGFRSGGLGLVNAAYNRINSLTREALQLGHTREEVYEIEGGGGSSE